MASSSDRFSLEKLCTGMGVNHENQKAQGEFKAKPIASGKGLQIEFRAVGKNGAIYHEEVSIIAPSLERRPCLFTLSNNHPGVTPHLLKNETKTDFKTSWVFEFGDISNTDSFREEIALELWNDGSIEYTSSSGVPGGEFKRRSSAKMSPGSSDGTQP